MKYENSRHLSQSEIIALPAYTMIIIVNGKY